MLLTNITVHLLVFGRDMSLVKSLSSSHDIRQLHAKAGRAIATLDTTCQLQNGKRRDVAAIHILFHKLQCLEATLIETFESKQIFTSMGNN